MTVVPISEFNALLVRAVLNGFDLEHFPMRNGASQYRLRRIGHGSYYFAGSGDGMPVPCTRKDFEKIEKAVNE
jgi:hypothetical protein